MENILTKKVSTEVTLKEFFLIKYGLDYAGVSLLLDDRSVVDIGFEDVVTTFYYETLEDFYKDYFLSDVTFITDIEFPEFPEIIKAKFWEW